MFKFLNVEFVSSLIIFSHKVSSIVRLSSTTIGLLGLTFGAPSTGLSNLNIKLLKSVNAPVSGKKADLILRVQKHVSDDSLLAAGAKQKYELTPLGEKELEDNSYVPYMHNSHEITMDLSLKFDYFKINFIKI